MKIPRNWGLDSSALDFSSNCCIQGGCFALFKFMMILIGKKNRVSDFSAFFKDLEGLFQYQRSGLTTYFSPGPLDSFYHMMPHLKCALSTARISHTSSSWLPGAKHHYNRADCHHTEQHTKLQVFPARLKNSLIYKSGQVQVEVIRDDGTSDILYVRPRAE